MSIRLNIGHDDAEKIAACIKRIAGNVSASDIMEIVLKDSEVKEEKLQEKPSATMTSREVAIQERFHPEKKTAVSAGAGGGFLLEGKPRSEYAEYCDVFNHFITGPAVEGREITELTEKYQKFYEVMKSTQLKAQESNRLEDALYGVAIEAEMQGFIYGFKMFDALLNKQLSTA